MQFACNLHARCVQIACNLHATGVQIACKLHANVTDRPNVSDVLQELYMHEVANRRRPKIRIQRDIRHFEGWAESAIGKLLSGKTERV